VPLTAMKPLLEIRQAREYTKFNTMDIAKVQIVLNVNTLFNAFIEVFKFVYCLKIELNAWFNGTKEKFKNR
jgi:hypothetical protein